MSDRVQDLTNHRKVAVACKNYTDKEIKASEERILSIVARNNVDFIDHTDEATYRFTAPANAKLLMLQSVAGNSVKYSPSVASDNNATHIKTLPSTVYDLDVSKVEGVGYKVNQLVANGNFASVNYWTNITRVENNQGVLQGNSAFNYFFQTNTIISGHKYLCVGTIKSDTLGICFFGDADGSPTYINSTITTINTWELKASIFTASSNTFRLAPLRMGSYSGSETYTAYCKNVMLFDLTAMGIDTTDVSVATSELAKRNIYLDVYETYNLGSIKNNAFTGVKVEGANKFDMNTVYSDTSKFTITGNVVSSSTPVNFFNTKRYFTQDEIGKTFIFKVLFTSRCVGTNLKIRAVINNVSVISGNLDSFPNYASVQLTPTSTADYIRFDYSTCSFMEISEIMLNEGTTALPYVPYIQPTTISVDLTTIKDSNNVSLFPSGKLMGNSSVADFITPYNQESRWNEYTFTGNESVTARTVAEGYNGYTINEVLDYKVHTTNFVSNLGLESRTNVYSISSIELDTNKMYITFPTSQGIDTTAKCIAFLTGKTMQYERATYLTSNTDLTSLTGIQGQSLGTITLNNTGNVDMPNFISYNAIIKHALATAVKQEGFNVWDEVWETGSLDATNGQELTVNNAIRSKNYISILPNTTYYTKTSYAITSYGFIKCFFDSNNRFISSSNTYDISFTTPSNAVYMRFSTSGVYGETYKNDICINISGTLNGTYKPHKPTYTRALTNNEAKYSWGITTGVRNVRTYCDDEGNAVNEGSLVVGNQDLGLLSYVKAGQGKGFYTTGLTSIIKAPASNYDVANTLSKYNAVSRSDIYNDVEGLAVSVGTGNVTIYTAPLEDLSTTQFGVANSGVMLQFEKKNTDAETLDDFDYFFDCEEGDTFTLVNTEQLQCYATYSFLIKEAKTNE